MNPMAGPKVKAFFERWGQVLLGGGFIVAGLRYLPSYGYVLPAFGGALALLGLAMAIDGWRRSRLRPEGEGAGVVQIVEGQIGYFSAEGGGFLALDDLIELWLSADGREWRLLASDGSALEIPRAARAAEHLPDEFARLPGLSAARLLKAVAAAPTASETRIWARSPGQRNPARPALT